MESKNNVWQAPNEAIIPDFIICGAMKSGTTTLHAILNSHPDIFIPDNEVHFFDMDNIIEHSDFNSYIDEKWLTNSVEKDPKRYWQWYSSNFSNATSKQVLGEDSTTYLASPLAFKRISIQKKPIKLLIMLRNPTARAYSQYWHMLRSGRAIHSFEKTLQYNPASVLNRSLYYTQILSLLRAIPKAQVKFIIFEEFLQNKNKCLKDVCDFLGVNSSKITKEAVNFHENSGLYPKYLNLQLVKNKFLPMGGYNSYQNHFSLEKRNVFLEKIALAKVINKGHRLMNPLINRKPPKMKFETKILLDTYFIKELEGLNDVLARDVLSIWF
ncbi:MAG: hypothetical protein COA85_13870 [Robiginitomaculum sp.]|nr:MAG: hypothetical protein COA85_13870 [Robiginitomaculum sp.]